MTVSCLLQRPQKDGYIFIAPCRSLTRASEKVSELISKMCDHVLASSHRRVDLGPLLCCIFWFSGPVDRSSRSESYVHVVFSVPRLPSLADWDLQEVLGVHIPVQTRIMSAVSSGWLRVPGLDKHRPKPQQVSGTSYCCRSFWPDGQPINVPSTVRFLVLMVAQVPCELLGP